ncbi:MAG TPA: hypothetical protein VGO09_08015 [Flavisolibacter sp.]|nr:hypothetical protein [Flavisolibacter sp.]
MKLSDFKLLPLKEQLDILYYQGSYIGKRKAGPVIIILYQLEEFYIEIYYTDYRRHISRVNYFVSTCFLDPYLEQMTLEHIV